MLAFLLKRLGLVVPTFLGITLLVFSLIRLIPAIRSRRCPASAA
jgi:dipeptide transport system permease protein